MKAVPSTAETFVADYIVPSEDAQLRGFMMREHEEGADTTHATTVVAVSIDLMASLGVAGVSVTWPDFGVLVAAYRRESSDDKEWALECRELHILRDASYHRVGYLLDEGRVVEELP